MDSRTNEFTCQICFNPFDEKDFLPKILSCGHTLCKTCVSSILKSNKSCSICRRNLIDSEPATNFSLLNLCESFTKSPTNFKEDLAQIYIRKISTNLKNAHSDLLEAIKDTTALDSLRSQNDNFGQQMEDVRIAFNEIKMSVEVLQNGLLFTHSLPDVNVNIKSHTLGEVAERLMKGEKMFAVANINDKMKYGKVFCRGNWIFISSLTLTEIDRNSSIFWMYDFTKKFNGYIYPFFTFSSKSEELTKIIQIKSMDNFELMELCTGETGTTFKNCPYFCGKKSSTVSVNLRGRKGVKFYFAPDAINMKNMSTTSADVLAAQKWAFTRNKRRAASRRAVGKFFRDLKFPFLFPNDSNGRIVKECGIAVTIS